MFEHLKNELIKNNTINNKFYEKFDVKRGLRNKDGSGVLAGLSHISSVIGFHKIEGDMHPVDGDLKYRGYSISELLPLFSQKTHIFEQTLFLLLVGRIATTKECEELCSYIQKNQVLPDPIISIINSIPSQNIMNKLQTGISALYAFDKQPDSIDPYENFLKSLRIIAKLPSLIVYSYDAAFKNGSHFTLPKNKSLAETFLQLLHHSTEISDEDLAIFDLSLMLHAEHGGGNNSTFTTYVVTSSASDIFSTLAAATGSLKGPLHGAANKKVMEMLEDIKKNVRDWSNIEELSAYLEKIINNQAHDQSGKIYGLGHAVYTKSDPRALLLLEQAESLAHSKNRLNELNLYKKIAEISPALFQKLKQSDKVISPNVDFFSGFVYDCLKIPSELYTCIFAFARSAGWCSHRIEELLSGKRIIRPGYKFIAKD